MSAGGTGCDAVAVQLLPGHLDQRQQLQAQPVLADDADDAQRGAAQRIGVAGAGRLLADGEEAGQLIQLVGQRHGDRDRATGTARRAARRVVVADGVGDAGGPRRRAGRSSGP